jgi:ABC-2 type transport system ATP-binding protein
MISVENLTKKYDSTTAIAGVSFTVERGEVLGFLGPNGAGKTTTMRAITGYVPATLGRVVVDGFDVFEKPLEVRRRIGYLPENPPLYPEMTVEGYLRFVAKIKGVSSRQIKDEIARVMETVSIVDVSQRIVGRLSKGYKQRVGLAQALLNDPPVLILDEPTVGLDPKQIHEVRELIKAWSGNHTVILSTHILPEVEQTCSRVVIIDRGRIIAVDTPGNLVRQLKGGEQTLVEVRGPVDDVLVRFQQVPGVVTAHLEENVDGRHRIRVETSLQKDVRPELARAVVENGWELFEMQSSRMSLEDIFIKLTTSDSPAADQGAQTSGKVKEPDEISSVSTGEPQEER